MEVKKNKVKNIEFKSLYNGDVFEDSANNYWMKTEILKESIAENSIAIPKKVNCIRLQDGVGGYLPDDVEVRKLNGYFSEVE